MAYQNLADEDKLDVTNRKLLVWLRATLICGLAWLALGLFGLAGASGHFAYSGPYLFVVIAFMFIVLFAFGVICTVQLFVHSTRGAKLIKLGLNVNRSRFIRARVFAILGTVAEPLVLMPTFYLTFLLFAMLGEIFRN